MKVWGRRIGIVLCGIALILLGVIQTATDAEWTIPTGRGATLVVAASDALIQSRVEADYVCDGTADDVEIQAAIDASQDIGGDIRLTEGNFETAAEIDLGASEGLVIRGSGQATIVSPMGGTRLYPADGATHNIFHMGVPPYTPSATRARIISIRDLTIDGRRNDPSPPTAGSGIAVNYADNVLLFNVRVTRMAEHGVEFDWTPCPENLFAMKITNCAFDGNGGSGIYVNKPNVVGKELHEIIIIGNTFEGNGTGNIAGLANSITMVVGGANNGIIIIGNRINASRHHGMYLLGVWNAIISNNTILFSSESYPNTYDAIYLGDNGTQACQDITITGNRAADTGAYTQQRYGLAITGGADGIVVVGNNFRGNTSGSILSTAANPNGLLKSNAGVTDVPGVVREYYLRTGEYYFGGNVNVLGGSFAIAADTLYAVPFFVSRTITLDSLALKINVPGAAGTTARLGIYADGANKYPDGLLLDAGTVPVDAAGVQAIAIDEQLPPGLYWMVVVSDGAPQVLRFYPSFPALGVNLVTENYQNGWKAVCVFGALPESFPGGRAFIHNSLPAIPARVLSLDLQAQRIALKTIGLDRSPMSGYTDR